MNDGYVYLIQIDAEAVDQFKESLKELDDYIHFQPNYRYKTFSTPNTEPSYFRQETEMDLMEFESDDGPNSWVGSSGIGARVAVLDTGIYPEHQDFCGDNGTFNESAQIMDVSTCDALDAPYDFVTGGTPTSSDILDGIKAVTGADYEDEDAAPYDKNGHGTHVSGIIGARVNGEGIGGAAYNATILPIRVLAPYLDKDDDLIGLGQTSWIVNGINYAVTNNADVINMSLGGIFNTNDDLIMISAINAAYNAGVLIVAAAGNESSDFDNTKVAPAYYSNVMSVSSVNNTGQFASGYSNFGESLDVAAVGTYVYNAGINSPNKLRLPNRYINGNTLCFRFSSSYCFKK